MLKKTCRYTIISFIIVLTFLRVYGQIPKRAWEATDSYKLKSIRELQVAPDNTHLLFTVSERNLEENALYSVIYTFSITNRKTEPLTGAKGYAYSPRWSPDGKKIAYYCYDSEGLGLWIMNRDGSLKRKLTVLEKSNAYLGFTDFVNVNNELCWSPCGKMLAYTAVGPRHYTNVPEPQSPPNVDDVMVVDRLLYKSFYYYSDLRRTHVFVLSADGGKPERISSGDFDYHSISWSPNGRQIACVSNQTGRDDYNANTDICLLSVQNKEMTQLTHTIGPEYQPVFSPDGKYIVFLGRTRDHRSKESDAELKKVYVVPSSGGNPVNLTAPLDRWSISPTWSPDSKFVYFAADNSGKVPLYKAPVYGGEVTTVFEEDCQVLSFSPGKNSLYFVHTDFTHPDEIYRINPMGTGKEKLTCFNDELVKNARITDCEKFTFPGYGGLEIEGWIMKPYNFNKDKKYPLIFAIHGGPHMQYGYSIYGYYPMDKYQLYAANGYAVVFTNPRGSSGRGQEFCDMCVGDIGGNDYKDIMAATDYVLEKYDFIDSCKMGVTGLSYGGYMTNWTITHTNRFKAAVTVSGISNLISQWGTDCNFLWFESDMGFMPFENYERTWDVSPLKYVENCTTPVLFINGAWDFCTNLNQAEEMFTALKKSGIETVLAIYPSEGHGVANQPIHTHDYYLRTLQWFDKHLK